MIELSVPLRGVMEMSVPKMAAVACAMIGLLHAGSAVAGGIGAPAGSLVLQVNITSLNGQAITPITFDQTWNLTGPWTGYAVTYFPGLESAQGYETAAVGPSPVTDSLLAGSGLLFQYGGGSAEYDSADVLGTEGERSSLALAFNNTYADGKIKFSYSMSLATDEIQTYNSDYLFSNFLHVIQTQPISYDETLEECVDAVLGGCGLGTTRYTGYAQFVSYSGPVPEPKSWLLMALGLGAVGAIMRKRKLETRRSYRDNRPSALA